MIRVAVTCALLLAACSTVTVPEGRFQCADATACPSGWFCHTNNLCYSRAEVLEDAGVDASGAGAVDGSSGTGGVGGIGGSGGVGDAAIDAGSDSGNAATGGGGTGGSGGAGGTGGVSGADAGTCDANGEMMCGAACVNVLTNQSHCGRCNRACPTAGYCSAGTCTCSGMAGQTACGGECVNVAIDNNNCGGCGTSCTAPETCVYGDCRCPTTGESVCDGTCVNLRSDSDNCGSCGNRCTGGTTCVAGTCAPPCVLTNGGFEICDGVDNDCDGTVDQGSTCPAGCTGHTLATGVYVLCPMPSSGGSTWGYARGVCRGATLMMDLVRIDDATENAAVRAIAPSTRVWIGASDNNGVTGGPEGDWEWSDGTLFWRGAANGSAQGGLYANWAVNEPDNAGSGEGCAEMLTDGTWNDLPCGVGNNLAFICERN